MNRFLLLLSAVLLSSALFAQQIAIDDFRLNISDQTANFTETQVIDDNGIPCALLKIETLQKGFSFDGGTVGIAKVEENHKGEIWVYVPAKLRRITIAHDKLGILRDWTFPEELKPARVYVMKLISGSEHYIIDPDPVSQYFVLTFEPSDAMVEIDGVPVESKDGKLMKLLSVGQHDLRVSANKYHPEAAKLDIGGKTVEMKVSLKPAFGWIEVKGPSGASVYIDNQKIGIAPIKSEALKSGTYSVRVVREKYLPYRAEVEVNDNAVTTIQPTLTVNYVNVTLVTSADAEIWVSGEKKGTGKVSIDLEPGEYMFETRKEGHRNRPFVQIVTMESGGRIDLPAPVAITGTLAVAVEPIGASIEIDGKVIGKTPMMIDNVLIGKHIVRVSMDGYIDKTLQVTVQEGKNETVDGTLQKGKNPDPKSVLPSSGGVASNKKEISSSVSYANGYALLTVNGITLKLIKVEGGVFKMGSNSGEENEKPVHDVTLSDYYIGETEVTQALWNAVMDSNYSRYKGANLPVMAIYNDCIEFIDRLNESTGLKFSLPTEAQWEYAARGGRKSNGYRYAGSNNLDEVGWNWNNSGEKRFSGNRITEIRKIKSESSWSGYESDDKAPYFDEYRKMIANGCQPHPVGQKKANELGLYDMSGNMWEWCIDWFGSYEGRAQTNPVMTEPGKSHVSRGGGWTSNAKRCRTTKRGMENVEDAEYTIEPNCGLRLVLIIK